LFTPREPNQLERTDEGDVEEGECHAPSSSSVSRQQKSRPMSPDDVFGMHRVTWIGEPGADVNRVANQLRGYWSG
jgi:hypothetical protein